MFLPLCAGVGIQEGHDRFAKESRWCQDVPGAKEKQAKLINGGHLAAIPR